MTRLRHINPRNFDNRDDYLEAVADARGEYRAEHPPLRQREGAPVTEEDFAPRLPKEEDPF